MNTALSIRNLCKTYSGGLEALRGVDLDVQEGDFYALLGPNGAGKSTLIGILTNLVRPTAGEIHVFGVDARAHPERARTLMGVVPQEFNFNVFEKTLEILVFQAGLYGIPRNVALPRAQELLERLGLGDQMNQIARHLSGGMKRRLMVARALVNAPRLLILDEPTAGVDIELRRGLWEILTDLNQKGTTIILTTHYLEEAEHLCRNLAIIDHGVIVQQGPMRALLAQLDVEGFLFDVDGVLPAQLPQIEGTTLSALDGVLINYICICLATARKKNSKDALVVGWNVHDTTRLWLEAWIAAQQGWRVDVLAHSLPQLRPELFDGQTLLVWCGESPTAAQEQQLTQWQAHGYPVFPLKGN